MKLAFCAAVVGLIAAHCPTVADPLYCSTWNGIRTCSSPGGYVSHESTWNGITTGDDNWAAAGRPARWMGVETTTVEPGPGRMMVDHGQHQPSSMRSFRIVAHVAGWLRVSLRICP
jgi:hypothetical protein